MNITCNAPGIGGPEDAPEPTHAEYKAHELIESIGLADTLADAMAAHPFIVDYIAEALSWGLDRLQGKETRAREMLRLMDALDRRIRDEMERRYGGEA